MLNVPEPSYRQALREIAADTRQTLSSLVLREADGTTTEAPLGPGWNKVPGRPGMEIFNVPHRNGEAGLFMAICAIKAGSSHSGGYTDESQLIAPMDGVISCNGQSYRPGEFIWLAPGQPAKWEVGPVDYTCVIRFNVPPHDIPAALFQPL